MKAILHIGTEKTGSTSIQEFLYKNKELLSAQNFEYISFRRDHHARALATYCMEDSRSDDFTKKNGLDDLNARAVWKNNLLKDFEKRIGSVSRDVDTVIFSSEHFHSRLLTVEEVTRLKKILAPWFDEVSILLYLRRQDRLALSLFSTRCRTYGKTMKVFPSNVNSNNPYFNYLRLVQRWADTFGETKIRIFSYEKLANKKKSVVEHFLGQVGLHAAPELANPISENRRLSYEVQWALVKLNRSRARDSALYAAYKKIIIYELGREFTEQGKMPSQEQAKFFQSHFHDSNRELERKFCANNSLFDQDFSMYPLKETNYLAMSASRLRASLFLRDILFPFALFKFKACVVWARFAWFSLRRLIVRI